MSPQILDAIDGVITVEISGRISPSDLAAGQEAILAQLRAGHGGSLLCICDDFQGWTEGDWSDLSFQTEADPLIRKMAVIGEKQWESLAMVFLGKGIRPFPIAFFQPGQLLKATEWLKS